MILALEGKKPFFGKRCFVAENAAVIGAATFGEDCSVWFGASVRADAEPIVVGDRTNIQDNATIHNDDGHPVVIGSDVSIGHNAVVHGAEIGDGVLIGMGAVVMNGVRIGEGSTIAAGAVVTENTEIPPYSIVMGVPARVIRKSVSDSNWSNARIYVSRIEMYKGANTLCETGNDAS